MSKLGRVDRMLIVVFATTFIGQFYLNPFSSAFRFSFSVIALNLFLLDLEDLPIKRTTLLVGLSMTFFRGIIHTMTIAYDPFPAVLVGYLPVWLYYAVYGLIFDVLRLRQKKGQPFYLLMGLWIADVLPNILEVLARGEWQGTPFETIVSTILITGLMRAVITVVGRLLVRGALSRMRDKERDRHMKDRLLEEARLQAELYYLRKSVHGIENAMALSYDLYEVLEEPHNREKALTIAKDIHEIKKDYIRVVAGFENTLSQGGTDHMQLEELVQLLTENSRKVALSMQKNVTFSLDIRAHLSTQEHYALLTILNNLVHNAMEAFDGQGTIHLSILEEREHLVITVSDDGPGIEHEDQGLIFTPGFSTKYNPVSGKMSTGIGLIHVKNLVEDHLDGTIRFTSEPGSGTCFTVTLPINRLIYE
jgi:two-component system sensor histidine kinase YcbA